MKKTRKSEFDFEVDHIHLMADIHAQEADRKAAQKARDESLRIALITNEINAGRVSETAGIYRKFLITHSTAIDGRERTFCHQFNIDALEHAANIGYVSAEETVEAAEEFAKHLSGRNERATS